MSEWCLQNQEEPDTGALDSAVTMAEVWTKARAPEEAGGVDSPWESKGEQGGPEGRGGRRDSREVDAVCPGGQGMVAQWEATGTYLVPCGRAAA